MSAPKAGDQVIFYETRDAVPVRATIVQAISESCVHLECEDGSMPTSVRLVTYLHGPRPDGYYCLPLEEAVAAAKAPEPAKFRFGLGATPCITVSGEVGLVVGRAEYLNAEPSYLLQYRRNDGVADEQWWRESALS